MKIFFFWTIRLVALVFIAYYGGTRLAHFLTFRYMQEMPLWLYDFIRFALDHTGNADIREPDDLSVLAIFLTLAACWLLVAAITIFIYKLAIKVLKSRASSA
jgi:hypothetical protein